MRKNNKTPVDVCRDSGSSPKRTRVLIVDDHPLMRKAIRTMVDAQPDMASCGEASSVNEALEAIAAERAELAVVDISMPDGDGIDLIREIKKRWPGLPVLVFSMHDEMLYAERAIRAGASGYVMKQAPPERLVLGLRAVNKGEMFVSQQLATAMLNIFVAGSPRSVSRTGVELLSNRELQVFRGIGEGLSTVGLAQKYGISSKTVDTYRGHIKRKLGLKNANGLVHMAVRWVDKESSGGTYA